MHTSSSTLLKNNSRIPGTKEAFSHPGNYGVTHIEERLFHMKTQSIIDELTQITVFIEELEKFGFGNAQVLEQIHDILTKLRSRDRNYEYTRIIHVLTKYLSGVRDFSLTTHTKNILFYKRLFESTLVAIIQELDSFDEEVC